MVGEVRKSSLRETLLEDVGDFLEKEGFGRESVLCEGVLLLANLISDYYEEGKHLYPELFITHSLDNLELTPSRSLSINKIKLEKNEYKEGEDEGEDKDKKDSKKKSIESILKRILKECAPLAIDGWVIFVELSEDCVRFGVFSTEITETTLSLYRQTVHEDSLPEDSTFVYIRSIGQKVVELRGKKNRIHIYLNLDKEIDVADNKVEQLSQIMTSGCDEEIREKLSVYLEKVIDGALKAGHGNLIGIVEDNTVVINQVKTMLQDGSYLDDPIDMATLVLNAEMEKSATSTIELRAFASLIASMINHDGITLMTDTGKLLGYHLFVSSQQPNPGIGGGARSRAFEAMKDLGLKACFYKSQDGNMKIYSNE